MMHDSAQHSRKTRVQLCNINCRATQRLMKSHQSSPTVMEKIENTSSCARAIFIRHIPKNDFWSVTVSSHSQSLYYHRSSELHYERYVDDVLLELPIRSIETEINTDLPLSLLLSSTHSSTSNSIPFNSSRLETSSAAILRYNSVFSFISLV